ncbi:hypothetical protein [Cetobacterium somerae]
MEFKLGKINWYGGVNKKTGKTNNFGFLSELTSGIEYYFKKEFVLSDINKMIKDCVVIFYTKEIDYKIIATNIICLDELDFNTFINFTEEKKLEIIKYSSKFYEKYILNNLEELTEIEKIKKIEEMIIVKNYPNENIYFENIEKDYRKLVYCSKTRIKNKQISIKSEIFIPKIFDNPLIKINSQINIKEKNEVIEKYIIDYVELLKSNRYYSKNYSENQYQNFVKNKIESYESNINYLEINSLKILYDLQKEKFFEFNLERIKKEYQEYIENIGISVEHWHKINYFFDYFNENWTEVNHKKNSKDELFFNWINFFKTNIKCNFCVDLLISRLQSYIKRNKLNKSDIVFLPVLASNNNKSFERYFEFCEIISNYLGIQNGIYSYMNHPKKKEKHTIQSREFDKKFISELEINSTLLKDKIIILFDDIVTSMETINLFENKISESNPKIIVKVALGKTLKNIDLTQYRNNKIKNDEIKNLVDIFDTSIIHDNLINNEEILLKKIFLLKNWNMNYQIEEQKILSIFFDKFKKEEIDIDFFLEKIKAYDIDFYRNCRNVHQIDSNFFKSLIKLEEKNIIDIFKYGVKLISQNNSLVSLEEIKKYLDEKWLFDLF